MKKEFATAIGLLALGCLLWLFLPLLNPRDRQETGHRPAIDSGPVSPSGPIEPLPGQPRPQREHAQLPQPENAAPHRASQALGAAPQEDLQLRSDAVDAFRFEQTDANSLAMLVKASEQTAQSQPWGMPLRLQGMLFGQTLEANGRYYQQGQGTHLSRLELTFGDPPQAPSVFQLCDGRFVYRLQTVDNQQSIEFINLRRVVETTGELPTSFSPTSWVATGGLSSLWQHLGSAFVLGPPQAIGGGLTIIRGSWEPLALSRVVGQSNVRWDQIPPQLPHAIEIVLAENQWLGQAPYQITYARFQLDEDNQPTGVEPTLTVTFGQPQLLKSLDDQLFVIDSAGVPLTDTTEQYIARIQQLRHAQTAANPQELNR